MSRNIGGWLAFGAVMLPLKSSLACTAGVMYGGFPVCQANLSDYSGNCPAIPPASQPIPGTVCSDSIRQALIDAGTYLKSEPNPLSSGYLINVGAGTFDLSGQLNYTHLDHKAIRGAIDLSAVGGLSANLRLIIAGAGQTNTTLITDPRVNAIYGADTQTTPTMSFITIAGMTITRSSASVTQDDEWNSYGFTQGTYVSATTGSVTVQIAQGYPSPFLLYCETLGGAYTPAGGGNNATCSNTNPANAFSGFMQIYTTNTAIQTGASTSNPEYYTGGDVNGYATNGYNPQVSWGASPPTPDPTHAGQWVIPLAKQWATTPLPAIYNTTTTGSIVCLKMKFGQQAFVLVGNPQGGDQDIVFDSIAWLQSGSGIFRGGIHNVTFTNSTYVRPPTPSGASVKPCIAGSYGGPQFGFNGDNPTWGNKIDNYTAIAPGDDGIAIDNDVSGQLDNNGVPYATTTVTNSAIKDSYARSILIDTTATTSGCSGSSCCDTNIQVPVTGTGANTILRCDGTSQGSDIVQCPSTIQNRDLTNGCPYIGSP